MKTVKRSNFIGLDLESKERTEALIRDIDLDLQNIFTLSKGRIRFGDGADAQQGENIAGEFQVVADTGAADTEFIVAHLLGVVPIGFLVINIDAGGVIYDSGTAWTATNIYLKCSAANAAVTLFLIK